MIVSLELVLIIVFSASSYIQLKLILSCVFGSNLRGIRHAGFSKPNQPYTVLVKKLVWVEASIYNIIIFQLGNRFIFEVC